MGERVIQWCLYEHISKCCSLFRRFWLLKYHNRWTFEWLRMTHTIESKVGECGKRCMCWASGIYRHTDINCPVLFFCPPSPSPLLPTTLSCYLNQLFSHHSHGVTYNRCFSWDKQRLCTLYKFAATTDLLTCVVVYSWDARSRLQIYASICHLFNVSRDYFYFHKTLTDNRKKCKPA